MKTTWIFRPSKLHRKSTRKWRGNSSKFGLRRIDVISTSNRRGFDVACPLGYYLKKLHHVWFQHLQFFKCRTGTWKIYFTVVFYISTFKLFQAQKFIHPKIKILKFGSKIALFGYFGQEFQKNNVVFEIRIFEFANMQSFIQKEKNFKLGTKNTLFGYVSAAI